MSEEDYKELYRPQKTTTIKSSGISTDSTHRTPFRVEEVVRVSTFADFAEEQRKSFLEKIGLKKSQEIKNYYAQVSDEHGRAIIDTRINRNVVWGDEYGIVFGSKDFKGAVMNHVTIISDRYSPYGLRTEGLKDNVGLGRIKEASMIMRQNGLPTELAVNTRKVDEIIDYNGKVPVEQWKEKYLNLYRRDADFHRKKGEEEKAIAEEEELRRIKAYFESTDFYVVERDLQVAERLRDLTHARTPDEFEEVVKPVFKWVNVATSSKKDGIIPDTGEPKEFEFKEEDIRRYFGEWLPKQMGTYLAKMHKLGLAHGYPHAQNWSLVGTLYDLDSVHGSPLGDVPAAEEDYALDTKKTLESLAEIGTNNFQYLRSIYPELLVDSHSSFITAYIKERFGTNLEDDRLEELRQEYFENYSSIKNYTSPPLDVESWTRVLSSLREQNETVSIQEPA